MASGAPGSGPGTSGAADEELVRRFCEGDREAFSLLVTRYQDRVFTICLRWLGEREAAEEVAQEVFLAVYRSLPNFRGDSKFSTWIFRIAVNHCKNRRSYSRRRASDRHEPLEGLGGDDAPPRELPHPGPGTDEALHRSEAGKLVLEALEELDESHRAIVILRDVDGLAYEEIADILELARGTVKSRLHRARAQLARSLSRFIGKDDIFD